MKLQAQLETSRYSEELLRKEVEVKLRQRRDSLIGTQANIIGELRAELASYKQQHLGKPEGKFLDYLEDFQAETVRCKKARLTAETEALLTKHERKVPQLSLVKDLQGNSQRDILE
jgi:hypothetical protein